MCSDLRYVGERPDAAAIYKLLGNAMILAVVGGINDVLRIAGDARTYASGGLYALRLLRSVRSMRGRGKRMAGEEYEPMWTLDMAHKDAVLMQAAAHHERLPVIDAMEAMMRSVSDRGLGELDLAAVAARS